MMDEEKLIRNVDSCIKKLKEEFIVIPKQAGEEEKLLFFGEKYLHYILYKDLLKEVKNYEVKWEFPTKHRYKYVNGKLVKKKDGKRARFDLAIADKNDKTVVAIEFSFQPETFAPKNRTLSAKQFSQHAENDSIKLCEEKVEHPYILPFILKTAGREWKERKIATYQKNKELFKKKLYMIYNNYKHKQLKILFAEVDMYKKEADTITYPNDWLK